MSATKICIGCNSTVSVGEKCKYCGTVCELNISPDLEDILFNATTLRREGNFSKAKDEYLRVIERNPRVEEAFFGAFLSDYSVPEYRLSEDNRLLPIKSLSAFNVGRPSANEYYVATMELAGRNRVIYEQVAIQIEQLVQRNRAIKKQIKENGYRAYILCDERKQEDVQAAWQIYNSIKNTFDVFYPPITLSKYRIDYPDIYDAAMEIAASDIKLMFVVSSTGSVSSSAARKHYVRFCETHKPFQLMPIIDDEFDVPDDMVYKKGEYIEFSVSDVADKVIDNIRIMSLDLSEMEAFRRQRHFLKSAHNPSPQIVL